MIRDVKLPPPRIPKTTPTPGADLALADAYRQWFALCRQERARGPGSLWAPEKPWQPYQTLDLGHDDPCEALTLLREIRTLQLLCSNPDLVYEVTRGAWRVEHGEEP
jgi:hypothetical protein